VRLVAIKPQVAGELSGERRQRGFPHTEDRQDHALILGPGVAKLGDEGFHIITDVDDDTRQGVFRKRWGRRGLPTAPGWFEVSIWWGRYGRSPPERNDIVRKGATVVLPSSVGRDRMTGRR
jgi:hypothetical protein